MGRLEDEALVIHQMPLFPSTSSDTDSSNVESHYLPNAPTSSPAVEYVSLPPEIQRLVCETCWQTFFSADTFRTAWATLVKLDRYDWSAWFTWVTPTWRQIQRQRCQHLLKNGYQCQWCKLVCKEVKSFYKYHKIQRRPPKNKKFTLLLRFEEDNEGVIVLLLAIEKMWKSTFRLHTSEDNAAARCIRARELLLDVDSPMCYSLIQKSFDKCARHTDCPPPSCVRLPTRVIDCADRDQPRIFINKGMEGNYVALSYVWGEEQPHRTTTRNLASYNEGIPLQNIPQTILDAITVTRKLGLRYLWVDSFCILQDSEDDKAREIAQMRYIFRNSYVTIIAACAHKVSDGFLHDRRPAIRNLSSLDCLLPFYCPDGGIGTVQLRFCADWPQEPVSERAWCLEERVLSPRCLIYATHTLLYECQTAHKNVDDGHNFVKLCDILDTPHLPDCIFLPSTSATPVSAISGDDEIVKGWDKVLGLYTKRTLTKPRDRLIAMSGIAEQFHQFWSHSKYVAGLWVHQLPHSLLWNNLGNDECRRRPDRYRAPSWSWASTDGEIGVPFSKSDNLCTILHCDVTLAKQRYQYGEVIDGSLVLDTIVHQAMWNPVPTGWGYLFEAGVPIDSTLPASEWDSSQPGMIGYTFRDAIEPISEQIGNVYLALVEDTGSAFLGLVLVPVIDQTDQRKWTDSDIRVFRRVGMFQAQSPDTRAWLRFSHESIRIV
ncbi:HET-domain-containing protein [Armillaria solidipes]|uniref:HET-domain-containing protein n=1 Tax=Armillaria solidipes TaxID=1076256 RepID=A0A2H3C2N8_9AGAR|nr:HET-domain-containing protein [Armillaria solidipes]